MNGRPNLSSQISRLRSIQGHHLTGKGQLPVIIYTIFVELEKSMLAAKFQDHSTSGSEDLT